MTRPKHEGGRKKGRPQSLAGQVDTPLSRQIYKCRVCDIEKRSDKLRNHYRKRLSLMKLANLLMKIRKNILDLMKTASVTLDTSGKTAIHEINFRP